MWRPSPVQQHRGDGDDSSEQHHQQLPHAHRDQTRRMRLTVSGACRAVLLLISLTNLFFGIGEQRLRNNEFDTIVETDPSASNDDGEESPDDNNDSPSSSSPAGATASSSSLFDAIPPHWANKENAPPVNVRGVHWDWHPSDRADRFPSVEDRVRQYMGNWYLPPCEGGGGSGGDANNNGSDSSSSSGRKDERLFYRFDYSRNGTFPDVKLSNVVEEAFDGQHKPTGERKVLADDAVAIPTIDDNVHRAQVLWKRTLWREDGTETCFVDGKNGNLFCADLRTTVGVVEDIIKEEDGVDNNKQQKRQQEEILPVIFGTFGDQMLSSSLQKLVVPYFLKARLATTADGLKEVTSEENGRCSEGSGWTRKGLAVPARWVPDKYKERDTHYHGIIWPLKMGRHFGEQALRMSVATDVPWGEKMDSAVWRGANTNINPPCFKRKKNYTFDDECDCSVRCMMVRQYRNSTIVNAKFVHTAGSQNTDHHPGYLVGERISISEQIKHKVVINLEGNDVSTGLKWNLLSGSVVVMPKPTRTSYLLEEMLEPWVHFVPIENRDLSDLEDKVQWVLDHDTEAQIIAERGKLFIADLLFHRDSPKDNEEVARRILGRYFKFFKKKSAGNGTQVRSVRRR